MNGWLLATLIVVGLLVSLAVCLLVARGIDIGQNARVMPGPRQEDKP
jgi:hypothetical protein